MIDAHVHIGPEGSELSARQLMERMEQNGIEKALVFPFLGGSFTNDAVESAMEQYPDKIIGICAVNPFDEDAPAKLERCFKKGFRGLKLHPFLHGLNLSSHLNDGLFELVQEYKGIVIAHGTADLYNCPLEFDRMARRFPKVPLIMAHSGYFWEWEQAVELAAENPNLFLETSRVPEYETGKILEGAGPGKVIWGSDSPYCGLEQEISKMRRVLKQGEEEAVLGGTIERLLSI